VLPQISMEGRVVADPELRYASTGTAVGSFRIAANDRKFNRDTNEWTDGDPLFLSVTCFKQLAENCAESLRRGDLVIVNGKLQMREWETDNGEKRSQVEILADSVAASIRFRNVRHGEGMTERSKAPAPEDPWTAPPSSDEPPF
jgi:single-strand DNA-binding protein